MSKKFSENKTCTRSYSLEFSADEEKEGVIEGVPIVFNQRTAIGDYFYEIIDRNALDNTDMKDVRLFVNHDTDKISLARSKNGNGTMKLWVEDDGLHMRAELDVENNTEARNLYSAVKRGDMDGMSFMFRIDNDEWEDLESEMPTRTIKGISIIHEVSVVNFPAYKQTSVSARSSEETELSSILEEARSQKQSEETDKKKFDKVDLIKLKYSNRI